MTARRSADLPDTTQPQGHRTRTLWVAVAIVVAIVAGVATWYALRPTAATPETTSTATASPSALGTGLANGCLAGPDKTVNSLIDAQKGAPQTTLGATELAASFARWYAQYPWPSSEDSKAASSAFASTTASPTMKDLAALYASRPKQPAGETAGISLVKGRYFIESADTGSANIVIGSKSVENGAESATFAFSQTFSMVWEEGAWKITDISYTMDPQDLFEQGTPFAGGC